MPINHESQFVWLITNLYFLTLHHLTSLYLLVPCTPHVPLRSQLFFHGFLNKSLLFFIRCFCLNDITVTIFLHLSKSHPFLKVNPRSILDKLVYLLPSFQALIIHLAPRVSIFAFCCPLALHEYKTYSPRLDHHLIF